MAGTTLTLADMHRAMSKKGDTMGAAVVEMFLDSCDILPLIDFKTLPNGSTELSNTRTNSIPTVGFRAGRGARFGGIDGVTFDEVHDSVWHMGAEIDIDKTDLKNKSAGDILGDRTRLAVKGMNWTFKDYFINGDHGTDPYGFEGLKVRLANSPTDLVVYGNSSSAELDVRPSASPSEADLYQFLDRIDAAIEALDGHTADIALTSSDFIATLRSVLRRLGKYTERPIDSPNVRGYAQRRTSATPHNMPALIYPEDKGIKWYPMGYKADQTNLIVGTETVNSVACRPVYFVKLGHPYIHGIQQYSIEVEPPMKLDDGVTYRVTVDWPLGLHHVHNRSISKLTGVRVA